MDWEQELIRTVVVLAQPAAVQRSLFPASVCVGDEMVIEFGEARDACKQSGAASAEALVAATTDLNVRIDELSGKNMALWLDPESLGADPRWAELRRLAAAALDTLGIDERKPEASRAIYVQQGDL